MKTAWFDLQRQTNVIVPIWLLLKVFRCLYVFRVSKNLMTALLIFFTEIFAQLLTKL